MASAQLLPKSNSIAWVSVTLSQRPFTPFLSAIFQETGKRRDVRSIYIFVLCPCIDI
jgi:hypothetical protein